MDKLKDIKNAVSGNSGSGQQGGQNSQQGGGKNTMVDSAVDQEASKHGVPAGADPAINNVVNDGMKKI
ncbi:Uu.00g011190.m01.CDS01 [Anthostomella pinea]|uniref:Uu.00g011190.m01.CDS01 n=1 Tax=Anthostomella pinea TaxID=933095 RepID=A0AAI8VYB8_9PEZI|nr:Uu.00g011190.m01.CDS01 [Anthostomella pinea]